MGSFITRCVCCKNGSLLKDEPQFSQILSENATEGHQGQGLENGPKQYSWDKRPKLNPDDYIVSNLNCGSEIVKRPGEINGQQFIIRNCSNARIYLFDFSSSVTIDDCIDCLIVLGPVSGSVFLRDTKNSTLVSASSQLRLRDCGNINLFVASESDPIIEASSEIIVGPYYFSYKGIQGHFKSANLNRFKTSRWSEIYDFTPNELHPNWRRYDKDKCDPRKYICSPQGYGGDGDIIDVIIGDKDNPLSSFVPITHPQAQEFLDMKTWRKQETSFSLEQSGQDLEVLETFMEKFYLDKFSNKKGNILCDIEVNRNQYTFSYFQC